MERNSEMINQWRQAAPYWDKYRETIREMFAPVTEALIKDAKIKNGSTVLDVATGPGEPALSIAGAIGPEGKVVGTDAVPEMAEAARQEARRSGIHNASFESASAENLPFPANTFDTVVSRFGVMFFPHPGDAVREMLRVIKPGGAISLAVWHLAERNPFFHVISQVVERYVETAPAAPDSPDAFRFAEPGKLLAVLEEAGVAAGCERLLRFTIRASIPIGGFWTLRSEMSEKLRMRIAALSEKQLTDLTSEVIEALAQYRTDTGMSFPAEVLIVTGRKESS